jgi:predicted ATP-grasp superfamily ATP-dependent carboligase
MTVLAVAGVSVRCLAEAAARESFEVVALDLFGDADTRRAASQWQPVGRPGSLELDADLVLQALRDCAARGDVAGWIAGAGFEGRPELIEQGAERLPLIGTPADAVRRVRDPDGFFAALDALGLEHPAVRQTPPDDPAGWLSKDAHGCGGWHIRSATAQADRKPGERRYFQRERSGASMSATFIADGRTATVLGCNEQMVRAFGARPHVYCGVVGPVPLPDDVRARVDAAVQALVREFGLLGLGSVDFLLDGDSVLVLEVNPRPPASIALYAPMRFDPSNVGLFGAHLRSCQQRELPRLQSGRPADVEGCEIVYARQPLTIDAAGVQHLAGRPDTHDRPASATRFDAGDPVCSVSARGPDARSVRLQLERARIATLETLESLQ